MRVLIITGDHSFKPGHPRYELQKSAVDELAAVYWGRGSLRPPIPQGRWDVVTVQDPFVRGLFAWRAARRLGARFNVQVHTDLSSQPFFNHVLAQVTLRHADSVRVVSEKIKTQVERMRTRAKISVLPVYVDIGRFKNTARVPHAQKTILWLGRFEEEKDPLYALEVLRQVRESIDAKLVMLGAGGLASELKRRAEGLPVEFPGWQDPAPFCAQADAVLCTSRHESWGASIVEALAAGVPVVASDIGVAKDAGAVIAPRGGLAGAVVEVLRSGAAGTLRLRVLSKEEWARAWVHAL